MQYAPTTSPDILGRLDFNVSEKHKLFWSFRQNDRVEDRSDRFGNDVNGNYLSRVNWGTTIDDVYTLSPSLLLNTRAGWTRFIESNTRQSTGFDPTSVGLTRLHQREQHSPALPAHRFRPDYRLERLRRRHYSVRHLPDLQHRDQDRQQTYVQIWR